MSRGLVTDIYLLCKKYPSDERYGLISQTQRSAISITSNIAEGCGRSGTKQLIHFLSIAIGSLCELETQIYLANDLNYIDNYEKTELVEQITSIRKMTIQFQNFLSKAPLSNT